MAHTPTPWKISTGDDCPTVCFVGDVKIVAAKLRRYDLHENDEIDAAFIVRAVNAHDDLVDAMKLARQWMIPGMNWTDNIGTEIKEIVDAALAKHGGAA